MSGLQESQCAMGAILPEQRLRNRSNERSNGMIGAFLPRLLAQLQQVEAQAMQRRAQAMQQQQAPQAPPMPPQGMPPR